MNSKKTGLGFMQILTIVFIVLKLCHVIEWSWLWVLAPLWGPLALLALICIGEASVNAWKNRGTVPCKGCKYRGCISTGFFGTRIHCLKNNTENPTDHRCKEGVWRE